MATVGHSRATIDDLMKVEGKAELIGGRIVTFMASGYRPSRVALRIARLIDDRAEETGRGVAFGDGMGFAVGGLASGRESFSPDASYYDGPAPFDDMRFLEAAPTFAVEVRSDGDYGPAAEREMALKRADYFEAGTQVIWDVDPEAELVRVFRVADPAHPTTYGKGQEAEAEPALPGWRVAVERIFG